MLRHVHDVRVICQARRLMGLFFFSNLDVYVLYPDILDLRTFSPSSSIRGWPLVADLYRFVDKTFFAMAKLSHIEQGTHTKKKKGPFGVAW